LPSRATTPSTTRALQRPFCPHQHVEVSGSSCAQVRDREQRAEPGKRFSKKSAERPKACTSMPRSSTTWARASTCSTLAKLGFVDHEDIDAVATEAARYVGERSAPGATASALASMPIRLVTIPSSLRSPNVHRATSLRPWRSCQPQLQRQRRLTAAMVPLGKGEFWPWASRR